MSRTDWEFGRCRNWSVIQDGWSGIGDVGTLLAASTDGKKCEEWYEKLGRGRKPRPSPSGTRLVVRIAAEVPSARHPIRFLEVREYPD